MQLRFEPFQVDEVGALSQFLAASDWPFHHQTSVDASWVRGRIESGHFFGSSARSFWVRGEAEQPLAFGRIFDLEDVTPLIDLRVDAAHRGRGIGTLALRGLTAWLFSERPEAPRLGGYTRVDNLAMRRVFEKCGYLKEAHHRRAWRVEGGELLDCVGYAILRDEFDL
jgi:RimJ/RimL family protein N-acetyltransferase